MKIFISSDIEGTTGICDWEETEAGTPRYAPFRSQMTAEVAAACQGAIAAGAEEILVRDAHDSARNIDPAQLPGVASILRGWTGDLYTMMSGIDTRSFDAAMMTGYHSWASAPGNPLSHTMNLKNEEVLLNGEKMSEFTLNAYIAGYLGVPVCFLSGDEMLCQYASSFIPGITTVAVNRGIGGGCVSIQPAKAVALIHRGVERALSGDYRACQVHLPQTFEMVIRFREHKVAFSRSFYPGAVLRDPKTVAFSTGDFLELLRFVHFVL